MAEAADSTPAPGGQFALTVADLNTVVNHEPRVSHRKLASALGFTANHKFAHLIERHREALERLGEVSSTVDETSAKGGRPGRTIWLNKRQALYLCTKSETSRATETTIAMVEVFDAHLAGRAAPSAPPAAAEPPAAPGPLPFLPGPGRRVASQDLAAALGRRHKHVLRDLDALASYRPELLGRHLRAATYVHPSNGTPFRCYHLDRTAFAALMDRQHDPRAVALRAAALPLFGAGAGPARPALPAAAAAPTIGRDGLALMRIAGEELTVDLARWSTGPEGRAVVFDHDGEVTVESVEEEPMLVPIHGRRVARARRTTLKPYQPGIDRPALWVLGVVVSARPAAAPDAGVAAAPAKRTRGRPRGPRALPAVAATAVPDLARTEVRGQRERVSGAGARRPSGRRPSSSRTYRL